MKNNEREIVNVSLDTNDEFVVRRKRKNRFPPFQAMGVIGDMSLPPHTMVATDLVDILIGLTKGGQKLFQVFKNRRDPETNLCHYVKPEMTRSDQAVFSRNLKELIDVGLIKKTKEAPGMVGTPYMINPNIIMCREYDFYSKLWDKL